MKKPATLEHLEYQKKKAFRNASRQRQRIYKGLNIKVCANFWEQVAQDYQRQINALKMTTMSNFKDMLFTMKVIANPKNSCRIWNDEEKKVINDITITLAKAQKFEKAIKEINNDLEFWRTLAHTATADSKIGIRLRGKVAGMELAKKILEKVNGKVRSKTNPCTPGEYYNKEECERWQKRFPKEYYQYLYRIKERFKQQNFKPTNMKKSKKKSKPDLYISESNQLVAVGHVIASKPDPKMQPKRRRKK